jgi:hypothetical protein
MSINIVSVSSDYNDNSTKVVLETYEMFGTIERFKEKLILTLSGKFDNPEDLNDAIDNELNKNGLYHYKVTE